MVVKLILGPTSHWRRKRQQQIPCSFGDHFEDPFIIDTGYNRLLLWISTFIVWWRIRFGGFMRLRHAHRLTITRPSVECVHAQTHSVNPLSLGSTLSFSNRQRPTLGSVVGPHFSNSHVRALQPWRRPSGGHFPVHSGGCYRLVVLIFGLPCRECVRLAQGLE